MADHKPLPAIPSGSTFSTLSVEARGHRSRLIRHILSETQEPGIDHRRDGWAYALEEALDEMGQAMSREEWLDGIHRGREVRRLTRQEQKENVQDTVKGMSVQAEGPTVAETTLELSQLQAKPPGEDSVKQLRALTSRPPLPSEKPNPSHLLLCASPYGRRAPLSANDSGFDMVPANIGCVFASGIFAFPHEGDDSAILYGLREWEAPSDDATYRILGGTFTFKGLNSQREHYSLYKVLKIAIYVHLSLVLEQQFLSDSGVQIKFPRPKLTLQSPSVPGRPPIEHRVSEESKTKSRHSLIPPGILSFFTRRTMGRRSNSVTTAEIARGGSLDLTPLSPSRTIAEDRSARSSHEGVRIHRLSFIGDRKLSFRRGQYQQKEEEPGSNKTFESALKRIEESRGLLSTSAGVLFSPPSLIVELAEKENTRPTRRLKGDERAGLSSLLGWDGKESGGKGMSGTLGFVRHQEFSILYSQHVPSAAATPNTPSTTESSSAISRASSSTSTSTVNSKVTSNLPTPGTRTCGRPHWITYLYYSRAEDKTLGETILEMASSAEMPCERTGCTWKRGQHELRLIHGGLRIVVNIDNSAEEEDLGSKDVPIEVWQSCAVCDAKTARTKMSVATRLLSFAKFLELLIYSPMLCTTTPSLCEHTTPPPGPWPHLPASRINIRRHFSTPTTNVSFSLSTTDNVYELRPPRLQIVRGGDKAARTTSELKALKEQTDQQQEKEGEDEKKQLRREIKKWWEGVADHIDKLEHILIGDDLNAFRKALPRLPSVDDAYEGDDETPRTPKTPSMTELPPLPPSTPGSPSKDTPTPKAYFDTPMKAPANPPPSPAVPPKVDSANLLASLRHNLQRTEQSLYATLARTPVSSLNDVRRSFLSTGKGINKRLMAWQKKHLTSKAHLVGELSAEEPEWWGKGCHAIPGGNTIVREDDWGSIIAFTLSSADYQRELANLSVSRASSVSSPPENSPTTAPASSFFSSAASYRLFSPATKSLDPDQEGVIWHEPEPYSAVISRKEHPRDPTSLLSIREVLRQKNPADGSGTLSPSRFGSVSSTASSHVAVGAPPSAWAKPDVSLTMQAAGGEVSGLPDAVETVEKLFHEIEASINDSSRPASVMSDAGTTSSSGIDAHIRRGKASSIASTQSDVTIGKDGGSALNIPPPPPPKDDPQFKTQTGTLESTDSAVAAPETSSSFAGSLANSLGAAMRLILHSPQVPRPMSPFSKNHHGLLLADLASIDERPHIKYDWTLGKRLKFSCTIYYAKQFDMLRKRCGIDDIFLKSLSRSNSWAADGGKSKSNFRKTADDRFIIKTLVDAWNVADLQVLIELAPYYFRYMESTASRPTVLAKLLGFYTIEIRNLETGHVQSKADLLIMENIFYDRNIVKTFDLKGIHGRRVKAGTNPANSPEASKTLFDGDWIEGQQRTLTLVRPHSKNVIREAIKSDAEYLARSNIMDYSLLLGVDEEHKQIACGLVDTIGSYTFAKTLEYKAKHNLISGKDITVIPPIEYQERFVSALEGYFLACPDKWSKPVDETKIINDPNLLPSVL
ncbi:hypothetical protein BDQ12DRAFT_684579 [Crucibulum laeve]|uniref:PIPK domain-containing protein n=1 Tax=Crucibulum laeve TaxID=68775 RepID=A0A5C3M035_9AGAR|nr:hypothetical protein BDQ12DRAFT_684579 [Crucibulum laeve]